MITHAIIDERILALVRLCMEKISNDPSLLSLAKKSVQRWPEGRLKREWIQLLDLPVSELESVLLKDSEEGKRLRQSAPFGGMLLTAERMRILNQYHT